MTSRLRLRETGGDDSIVVLEGSIPPLDALGELECEVPAGALVRIDGIARGAFDREHHSVQLTESAHERSLRLEVERRSLPTNGLPAGPGLRWSMMLRQAAGTPPREVRIAPARDWKLPATAHPLRLWGHSHLDVAWLWSFDATRRKATRTFATAVALLERDPSFVFAQSQPQLYEYVREADPELFERTRALVAAGRFDPDFAAMWVEPDCNIPSGESLLRQMLFAHRYCVEHFEVGPGIAWLPDTFGFARTLPTLLAHAGIRFFATTKLWWNDTTRFAPQQFRWRGPDGSEVIAASLRGMDGGFANWRVAAARERSEPLVVGYGDGGGGPTAGELHDAPPVGRWERPRVWFDDLARRSSDLEVYDDELYLEYHRGVYTTHRDVKVANARLERRLFEFEEATAWCVAVGAPRSALERLGVAGRDVWEIVLRNQFHDVLPGTSVPEVYVDALADYARAEALLDAAMTTVRAMLPRGRATADPQPCEPQRDGENYVLANSFVSATITPAGEILDLHAAGGRNVVRRANVLTSYRDRPKKWEAWNIDAGYRRSSSSVSPRGASVIDGGLEIRLEAGRSSPATMRFTLFENEPFLRVELAVDWNERRTLLRVEHELALQTDSVTYGAPHGTVHRTARQDTPAQRARFEVPGQRFAYARGASGDGFVAFALDTYGWSAGLGNDGRMELGHSLLRGATWPHPTADRGEQSLTWALAPARDASLGAVETAWSRFAAMSGVPLFETNDESISVAACKPAEDGDGVIVRVRECNGEPCELQLRCGARMREAIAVDGLERPLTAETRIDGEHLIAPIGAYALASFRVRFR
ncbi:MAG TPA: glycoside hydrolase family 38 C-terminal domain-containing protein [Candidatus Tumulicola sp.]|jgi:alpha-mannosidase